MTPYILWASVMRKQIAQDNKDKGFGEVSRIVGEMVSVHGPVQTNPPLSFSRELRE